MFDFLTLPQRTSKPRESGLTHVLDKGYSLDQVRQFLEVAKDYVDIVKLGWGTAAVTPNVKDKIALYQSFGIPVCFGGTFFEVCLRQNKLEEYVRARPRVRHDLRGDLRRHDRHRRGRQAGHAAPLRQGVQGAQRGRQQGRERGHRPVQVGRQHQARARGRRLEGHHRGPRVGHRGHLPGRRRGQGGPARRDRDRRSTPRRPPLRGAGQEPAGLVRQASSGPT